MQIGPIDLGKRLKDRLKALEASQASTTSHNEDHSSPHPSAAPTAAPFHFVNHGYDWRRRLELSSAELLAKLKALKAESPTNEGATVMAHSMGGLVALHALATAPDPTVFKGLILAGTPCQGTVNVLSPFRYGDGVLFNREWHPLVSSFRFSSVSSMSVSACLYSLQARFVLQPLCSRCDPRSTSCPKPVSASRHQKELPCQSTFTIPILGQLTTYRLSLPACTTTRRAQSASSRTLLFWTKSPLAPRHRR